MTTIRTTASGVATEQPIGEVFDPLGVHFEDPYPIYARAREHAPLFYSPRLDAWVLTRYADIRAVLRDPELFSSANALRPLTPVHPRAMEILMRAHPMTGASITTDGAQQRPFRALLTSALSPRRIAALEPVIRRRADELVDTFAGDGHAELIDRLGYPLPLEVIARISGLDDADLPLIKEGSIALSALTFGELDEDGQVAAAELMLAFQSLLLGHLRRRREQPADDAFTAIAATVAPGTGPIDFMTEAAMLSAAQELVLPGHSTSVAMIGNGLVRLLEDRSRWELLVEHPELVPGAVEEIARFDNPVHGFLRVTTAPTTLVGTELPAGAEVLLVYSSANRDPVLCERPDVFDLTRAPTHHLGFALGAHFCPGTGLGRQQVGIALETLVRRLPGLRLSSQRPVRIRRDFTMRGPVELHAQW